MQSRFLLTFQLAIMLQTCFLHARVQAADEESIVAIPASEATAGTGLRLIVSALPLDKTPAGVLAQTAEKLKPESQLAFFCSSDARSGLAPPGEDMLLPLDTMQGPLQRCSEGRFLVGKGSHIRVYLVERRADADDCKQAIMLPRLIVEEKDRDTLLRSQIHQILAGPLPAGAPGATPGVCAWAWPDIVTTSNRAFVNITAGTTSAPPTSSVVSVVTGTVEHFFLSADAVIKGADQLKYDSKTQTIAHKDSPDQLYLGVNYMMGDVYGKLPALDYNRVVIKIMFQPNKHPFNSVGVGVGYRFADIFSSNTSNGRDHSGFVLYIGKYWTKPAESDNQTPNSRINSTRIGLSYSIGTALEWLKK